MDAQAFWNVIGTYNQHTIIIQFVLLFVIVAGIIIARTNKKIVRTEKAVMGVAHLFIGIVFFGIYGTESVQKFFAMPLYLMCGILFLYEAFRNKADRPNAFTFMQIALIILYILYPIISYALGNTFPKTVTYIMPCPIVSLSLAIYASYPKKNIVLTALLTVWGLTGIKSLIFCAYEDIILLICGIYGVYLCIKEIKSRKIKK